MSAHRALTIQILAQNSPLQPFDLSAWYGFVYNELVQALGFVISRRKNGRNELHSQFYNLGIDPGAAEPNLCAASSCTASAPLVWPSIVLQRILARNISNRLV